MRLLLATALIALPTFAFAVGAGDSITTSPPKKTETTKDCLSERQWDPEIKKWVRYSKPVNGVWDPNLRKCIRPDKASYLDSQLRQDAIRELAYAGRYDEAQQVLSSMPDQTDDLVLTYWGFTYRKMGDLALGNQYYRKALQLNPDNILARSYMGQGFVEAGETDLAVEQWREIVARGGEGTWAESSLREAIRTGITYSY